MKGYVYQSDFARRYVDEEYAQAYIQGYIEGYIEGRTEAATHSLLIVLRVRGIEVPDTVREHILAQKDLKRLRRWLKKAVVATSLAEVIAEAR